MKLYIEVFQKENLVEHLLWQMISSVNDDKNI